MNLFRPLQEFIIVRFVLVLVWSDWWESYVEGARRVIKSDPDSEKRNAVKQGDDIKRTAYSSSYLPTKRPTSENKDNGFERNLKKREVEEISPPLSVSPKLQTIASIVSFTYYI